MDSVAIGVDIGGTKIAAGLVDRHGGINRRLECATNASEGGEAVISRALDLCAQLFSLAAKRVVGIGVATGGQVDPKTGVVFAATPLLPGWVGMPIKTIFEERFHVPTRVINDASAAAVGEHTFGAARGVNDFVLLTIGTGVGGGVYCDGKLLQGALGAAGAIGHMTINYNGRPCNCGSKGCLETYVSGSAMTSRALELAEQRNFESALILKMREDKQSATRLLVQAATQGDKFALEVLQEASEYLGWGLANILNLFNPALVIIGGGVAEAGDLLLEPAWRVAKAMSLRREKDPVKLVTAQLGNNAGLLGAASLIWRAGDD